MKSALPLFCITYIKSLNVPKDLMVIPTCINLFRQFHNLSGLMDPPGGRKVS